jgi:tight adherence protein B
MRLLRLTIVAMLMLGLVAGTGVAAEAPTESALVAQGADTSEFPTIALTVTLPVDMFAGAEADVAFTVVENGEQREVIAAEPLAAVRAPMDIVLVMDTSGSMQGAPMQDAKSAAAAFLAAMGPDDEFALVSFASDVEVLTEFTGDRDALTSAINGLEARGNTALYDGVVRGAGLLLGREGRDQIVVLLTDGGDTASASTLDQAVSALKETGAPMYTIGLETPEADMNVLATMAAQSRGRLIGVADSADLQRLYEDIARELTTQYRVSFESAAPNTTDLELRVVAQVNGTQGAAGFVIDNPYFELAEGEGTGVAPASPAASLALGLLIIALAFAAVALAVWALLGMFSGRPSRLDELQFYDQLHGAEDTTTTRAAGVTGVIREAVAAVAGRRGLTPLVHQKLERAGLPLRPVEYMYLHLISVVGVGVLIQVLTRSVVLSLLAVVVAVILPILLLESAITRRRRAFEDQLPEILSMIASSLRAGWGIQQSIDLVVQEMADPARSEFRRVQAESRLGLSVEEALEKMANRLDSDDFRWTVTAIAIQREVGGNLAEVLDLVASTMRERSELRRHIHALTSEGRLSAVILFVLPFFMIGLLLLVNPGYMTLMFTTATGLTLMAVGLILLVVGGIWLRRASEVEI